MNIQKINWKVPFKNPQSLNPHDFFKAFDTWIPNSPEVFVDVADYKHVHDGPLILLTGHYADYALDHGGRRLGFLYSGKRPLEGDPSQRVRETFKEFISHASLLEKDSTFKTPLQFQTNEFTFTVNDRAGVPNTAQSLEEIEPVLKGFFSKLSSKPIGFTRDLNPRARFSVTVNLGEELKIADLLGKI